MQFIKVSNSKIRMIFNILLLAPLSFIFLSQTTSQEMPNAPKNENEKREPKEFKTEEEINDWEARLELARVLSYLKRYDESLKEYQTLLQTNPESSIARMELARILFYQEKVDDALAEFKKIPSQDIDDASWIVIADIFRKMKKYTDAEQIYLQYLKKFPEDDKVRLKLAELLSWQKRYEESVHEYQVILSHHPDDIQVRRRYAQVLTWMGKDEEAIKEWKKSL